MILLFFKDLKLKSYILLSTYILLLAALLLKIKLVLSIISDILDMLSPFIYAIGIAFVLNLLMKLFDNKILKFIDKSKSPKIRHMKRPLSITLSLITIVGVLAGLIIFAIPQLIESVSKLGSSIPGYAAEIEKFVENYISHINSEQIHTMLDKALNMWKEILNISTSIIGSFLSNAIDITINVTSSLIDLVLSIVFAVYMLANKEKLILQMKKILFAFFNKRFAEKTVEIAKLANKTYSAFITGQCLEALIIGTLCFLGMLALRLPYAFLIGTLVGVTSIIPIFGAFIGTIPSLFIIFMVNPIKAVYFLIFILILQQVEGHFIYPRVVGNSVGLSAIWIMLAILIGSSIYGVLGVILGIPLFAVIYRVFADYTHKRLKKKDIEVK